MKIVCHGPDRRVGVLVEGHVVDASLALAKQLHEQRGDRDALRTASVLVPPELGAFIDGGDAVLDRVRGALAHLASAYDSCDPRGAPIVWRQDDVRLHAPHVRGARIACTGGNFALHMGSTREDVRARGIFGFWKVDHEIVGPDGTVVYPSHAELLDYEAELAVVFKAGKDIEASEASEFVWGVTLLVDWSIRAHRDEFDETGPIIFAKMKNFDTSCSMGPCIVVDEIDPAAVEIQTWVNGDRRQCFDTSEMVFSFGELVEFLSRDFSLRAGDVVTSGTGPGTAYDSSERLPDRSFVEDRFLAPGDVVEVVGGGVGALRTSITAPAAATRRADLPAVDTVSNYKYDVSH